MKIRYIEPKPKGATIYEIANLPKLGLPLLAACARDVYDDLDQKIYCELIKGVSIDWEDVESSDLVCISTTTNTTLEGYAYSERLRAKGIPVVFGGSHVTFMSHEALKHVDYVIRREGHIGWMQLLEWLRNERPRTDLHGVAGLSWIDDDGEQVNNPEAPPASSEDLDALPFPALDLLVNRDRMVTYPLMMKWGCPYDCNFCSVIKMFGRKLRSRSVENVMEELRRAQPERVFFYDDIFIVDKKQAKALFRQMIAEGVTPQWTAQIRADSLYKSKTTLEPDHELMQLMRDSGAFLVYVGFESITQEGLDSYNKKQTVEHITTSIKLLHDYGIGVHGMFVVGSDMDTRETVRATVDFAVEHKIDTIQMMMLTTLPGTAFDVQMRADGRVLTDDYSLYDGHHCIIAPKNMTPYELQMETWKGMLRFYSSQGWLKMFNRQIFSNLGLITKLLLTEWRFTTSLPRILGLTIRGRQTEAFKLLRQRLSAHGVRQMYQLFGVAVFRKYGRGQLLKFSDQADSMKHLDVIKTLPAWTPAPAPRSHPSLQVIG
jgi:anaerobic magnesium-protoporphyrin IX monomethyl ester cyclase